MSSEFLLTKVRDYFRELRWILFVRQMPTIAKDDQSRSLNLLVELFTIAQWHFAIFITPNYERGLFD